MINSIESEQAVLWCILIDNDVFAELELSSADFWEPNNAMVFESIGELRKEWIPVDLVTMKEILEKKGVLERIGWVTTLVEFTEMVPTTGHFKTYQESVLKASSLRNVNKLSHTILDGLKKWLNADEILADVYSSIANIEDWMGSTTKDIDDILEDTLAFIEKMKSTELIWLPFGKEFKWLDMMTGWIQPWYIYRVGWGSNIGKSWLMYNMLMSVLAKDDRVTFFALENEDKFTMKNLLWLKKWVNTLPEKIKRENYSFTDEAVHFSTMQNFRIDSTHKNLHEIFRAALKNKSKYIFIDYIQAIDIPWKFAWDVQKYAYYSLELQKFATKYWVAVIDLSQLSNDSQRWGISWSGSWEFKGGGSLKESCDVGIHIFEDELGTEGKTSAILNWDLRDFYKNFVKIKLSKNRLWGWVGTYKKYIIDFDAGGKYLINDI